MVYRASAYGITTYGPVAFIGRDESEIDIKDDMLGIHAKKTITQLLDSNEVCTYAYISLY